MFVLKHGNFYLMCYDEETEELLYSSSTYSAKKFETTEEIDKVVDKHSIEGYSTPTVKG